MKKISDLVSVTQFDRYQNNSNVAEIDEEKTKKVLNRLFTRFERIFPKFWLNIKSQEHLNGIKDEWFECFQRARITDTRLIQVGLYKAQTCNQEYLPKASKFIEWCTEVDPTDMGFPHAYEAFNIAGKINAQFSDYIHPEPKVDTVIKHAINQIGARKFREELKHEDALKLFERYYEISCRQFIQGEFSAIARGIEDKSNETLELSRQKSVIKEEYKELKKESALEAMKNMLK